MIPSLPTSNEIIELPKSLSLWKHKFLSTSSTEATTSRVAMSWKPLGQKKKSSVSGFLTYFFSSFFWLWNDVQLQPKLLDGLEFCRTVLNDFFTFKRPLLSTILYVWGIWSGSNNHVYIYHVHVFHWLANKKAGHRTDFEADKWPETGGFSTLYFRKLNFLWGNRIGEYFYSWTKALINVNKSSTNWFKILWAKK